MFEEHLCSAQPVSTILYALLKRLVKLTSWYLPAVTKSIVKKCAVEVLLLRAEYRLAGATYLEDLVSGCGSGGGRRGGCPLGCRRVPCRRLLGALGDHGQRHGHGCSAPPRHAGRRRCTPGRDARGAGSVASAAAKAHVPDVVQDARVLGDGPVGAAAHDHGPRVPRHAHRRRRVRPAHHPAAPHAAHTCWTRAAVPWRAAT
jgi:hypothetical protein